MRAHHGSMSKVSLAMICSWSWRADAPQHPRPAGAPARIGSIVHKHMELYVKGREISDADVLFPYGSDDEHAEAEGLFSAPLRSFLDSLPWTACEIGLRYDTRTDSTQAGPRRGDPNYAEIAATVIPGTLDLVSVEPDVVTVVDVKSGKHVSDKEQLYVQAVAAARYYDVPTARVAYVYARKTKCDPPEYETLDADALDMHAGRLSRLMRRLPTIEPVAGDHCWRCDSRPSCPAYGATAAETKMRELEEAGLFA